MPPATLRIASAHARQACRLPQAAALRTALRRADALLLAAALRTALSGRTSGRCCQLRTACSGPLAVTQPFELES